MTITFHRAAMNKWRKSPIFMIYFTSYNLFFSGHSCWTQGWLVTRGWLWLALGSCNATTRHVTVFKRRITWPISSSTGTRNHKITTVMVMKTADETPYPASKTSSRVAWLIKLPAFTINRRSKCKIAPTIFSIMRAAPKQISDTIRAANASRIFNTSRINPKNTWSTVYIPSPV